jgi:hypothetical protein
VGVGAVSIEAAVAGMVGGAWAESAGVGVMSVARWLGLMMAETAGSSGACGRGRGDFLPGLMVGVGAGEAGPGRTGTASSTVNVVFSKFCPPGVRHNVRKKSKFEFSKFSNWVGHYIG